jgi:DNA-binding beta-propeller fold protein YncE
MRRLPTCAALALAALATCFAGNNATAAPVGELAYVGCFTGAADICGPTQSGLPGMADGTDVAVSPNGRNVYLTSFSANSITRFDRDPGTGKVTRVDCVTSASGCGSGSGKFGLQGAEGVAVSADGRNVYMVGQTDDAVVALTRDQSTGALTYLGCVTFQNFSCGAANISKPGLDTPQSVAVSNDGKSVYVAAYDSSALTYFTRDPDTGGLTYGGCFTQGSNGCGAGKDVVGLGHATGVTVSPDDSNVYVASPGSKALARFSRNPDTGDIAYVGCSTSGSGCSQGQNGVASLDSVDDVVVSPDNRGLYTTSQVAGNALSLFGRDPAAAGAPTFGGCFTSASACGPGRDGISQLTGLQGVAISADNRSIYVLGPNQDALVRFARDPRDNAVTHLDCFTFGTGCGEGRDGKTTLHGLFQTAVAPDGRALFVAAASGGLVQFSRVPDSPPACAPAATASTTPGTSVRIPLTCADANGDAFTLRFPTVPVHGALTNSADGGSVLYVPDAGYKGSDAFAVQAVDAFGVAGPIARVAITVAPLSPLKVRSLRLRPSAFRPMRGRGASLAARRGTALSFVVDRASRVTFRVERVRPGHRARGRCRLKARRGKRCTVVTKLRGSFAVTAKAGKNKRRFSGRVRRRALSPGRYRLVARAKGGRAARKPFKILR